MNTPFVLWPLRRALLTAAFFLSVHLSFGQGTTGPSQGAFTIENYYKAKWGYAEEFIALWKKNHYPLLKKAQEKGDILSIAAEKPLLHSSEESRWDFRVIIVFKNSTLAFDPELLTPYKKALYPDAEKLEKAERHRFKLLLAHWDVMTERVFLEK